MTRMSGWAVLVAVFLASCGASPRRGGYGTVGGQGGGGGGQSGVGGGGVQASGDPRQMLEQMDGVLRQQGFAPVGPAVHGNLPANGIIAYAIEAQPNACYAIATLGRAGSDIDMVVLDAQGRTIGSDVQPDAHPWVSVCPGAQGRVIARVQMTQGTGDYYYAVYAGPMGRQADLAGFFGAQQEQVQQAQVDAQTGQRITAMDQRLGSERFQRIGEPSGMVLGPQTDRNFALNLQQGFCYAFATFGGPGARDTDVFLVDGNGNEITRDVETNVDAMVRYCPPQTGAYTLRVRMYAGQGPLFTTGYVQSQSGQAAQQTPVISQTSTAGAGLEDNFRLLDADMRARGYEPYGDPTRGEMEQEATRDFDIQLEGGRCYAILAVGDNGVRDLDVLLMNPAGQELDRDIEADPRPIVRVCPTDSGQFRMRVRMFRGSGHFVYAPYRWPRGTSGPFGLRGLIYVRLAEVTSLLSVEGYEPDADMAPGRGQLRREGAEATHQIDLQQGRCYSVLVVGGEGINDLDARLSSGNTELAVDGSRNGFPSVRHCPQQTGRVTLTVRAGNGAGQYFYQVFRQSGGS